MRLPSLLRLLAALAIPAGVAVACEESNQHVYTGQRWNDALQCLDDYAPIEMVPGADVSSTCPATCFAVDEELYVTTLCGPLPGNATAVPLGTSPCKEALAAMAKGASCSAPDAASEEPEAGEEGEDGGEPEGGAEDGGGDTGPDAPAATDASDAG